MKILVIGQNGQLASSFRKVDVKHHLFFVGQSEFDYTCEVSLFSLLDSHQPELIINCAAYTLVDLAETEREKCLDLNFKFVVFLADWCMKNNCKLIHFSTDYVFDGEKKGLYLESDQTNPLNWYGKTKEMSEKYLSASQAESIVFRISWVYSEFGKNFLKTMIRLGQQQEALKIVSDQIGSPCYAVNVAESLLNWIQSNDFKLFKKGIYHLTPVAQLSWFDFAEAIFAEYRKSGNPLTVKNVSQQSTADFPSAAQRPLNSLMDSSLAFKQLNLKLDLFQNSLTQAVAAL
jgi:dTDP-4-dehydrorhamnose reductase